MGNVDDLWDLKADPATIDSLEQAWKAQVKQLSWAVQFGKGSGKQHFDDNGFPYHGKDDFGNAVVVCTGNGVTTGFTSVVDMGPGDEPRSATRTQINVR